MREQIITCDHCYKVITEHDRIHTADLKIYRNAHTLLRHDLELCQKCAEELTHMLMDFIQPNKGD